MGRACAGTDGRQGGREPRDGIKQEERGKAQALRARRKERRVGTNEGQSRGIRERFERKEGRSRCGDGDGDVNEAMDARPAWPTLLVLSSARARLSHSFLPTSQIPLPDLLSPHRLPSSLPTSPSIPPIRTFSPPSYTPFISSRLQLQTSSLAWRHAHPTQCRPIRQHEPARQMSNNWSRAFLISHTFSRPVALRNRQQFPASISLVVALH